MKKFKIVFGILLACVMAFACLAFTSCGGPFDINTSEPATDDELKALLVKISGGAETDTESGLPKMFGGKSYSVDCDIAIAYESEYKEIKGSELTESTQSVNCTIKLDGLYNLSKQMTGKLSTSVSVDNRSSSNKKISTNKKFEANEQVYNVGDNIYAALEGSKETETQAKKSSVAIKKKVYAPLNRYNGELGSIVPEEITVNTGLTVDGFLAEVKGIFSGDAFEYEPELYISGGVIKVVLDQKSYMGIIFDEDDWTLSAIDVILKDFPLTHLITALFGKPFSGSVPRTDNNFELKIRKCSAETIAPPSDVSDYDKVNVKDVIELFSDFINYRV